MTRHRIQTVSAGDPGVAVGIPMGLGNQVGGTPLTTNECWDVTGNRSGSNPLLIIHSTNVLWWVSGTRAGWWDCQAYANTALNGFDFGAHIGATLVASQPILSDNSALAKGLAITNPNRAGVDIPVFAVELFEIPRMLKDWGAALLSKPSFSGRRNLNTLPRAAASRYLEWQFGILPFLNDLAKILDFQAQVDRKVNTLDRLGTRSSNNFAGTVYTDEVRSPTWDDYATPLYQEGRRVQHHDVCTRRQWVSTRWVPAVPLPHTDNDKRWLATRLAYGLDISLSTLWEAMPWSWLIDWFSNVGDVVSLSRNTVPVTHENSCVMTHTRLTRVIEGYTLNPGDTISLRCPKSAYEVKQRTPMGAASPVVEFNLPFLDGRQMSILGSLAVLKLR